MLFKNVSINSLTKDENSYDWNNRKIKHIIGIVYDKNLRDKLEVSMSKGRKIEVKEGEPTKFCNFILEDDSDFITVRVGIRTFPRYGKFIFEELEEGEVVYIRGGMGSGIRMFFVDKILNLRVLKEELDSKQEKK